MRDYNPKRYRTRIQEPDYRTPLERQLDKAIGERDKARAELDAVRDEMETLDKAVRNLTRQLDVAHDQQHKFRIAFMLFANDVNANSEWQTVWVHYLQRAEQHIRGNR